MSEPGFPAPRPRLCPRCGYDQQGVIDSWTEACPVRSPCSECGYDIEWSKVLGPRADVLAWFVEHVPRSGFARACVRTFLRLMLPWRFCSAVQLYHPVRLRRAAACIVLAALLLHVLTALATGLDLFLPLVNVRPRSGVVGLGFLELDGYLEDFVSCVVYGLFLPFAEVATDGAAPMLVGNSDLHVRLRITHMWSGAFVLAVIATLLVPCALALGSATLRQAKVKTRDIARAVIYSLSWLVMYEAVRLIGGLLLVASPAIASDDSIIGNAVQHLQFSPFLGPGCVALWLFVFWHFCLTRSLKVRQPWWHTLPVIVLAGLAAAAIGHGVSIWLAAEGAFDSRFHY